MSDRPLEDEILACKARCESYIERRIDEIAAESPNVPRDVIRNIVWRRGGCHCSCALRVLAE
jgi:hypothetical protein